MSNQEQKIQQALESLQHKEYRSILQAARAFEVPRSTLSHRLHGRLPRNQINLNSQRLTIRQEPEVAIVS